MGNKTLFLCHNLLTSSSSVVGVGVGFAAFGLLAEKGRKEGQEEVHVPTVEL